jgi:hypothetical protein
MAGKSAIIIYKNATKKLFITTWMFLIPLYTDWELEAQYYPAGFLPVVKCFLKAIYYFLNKYIMQWCHFYDFTAQTLLEPLKILYFQIGVL